MAKDLPDALELREIKYGAKSTDALRSQTARSHQERGRLAEALDLYLLAGNEAGINEIKEHALRDGRPNLLLMLVLDGREVTPAEWQRAAESAAKALRWREAHRAYTEAGDEEGIAKVAEQLPGYSPFTPHGK